MLSPIHTTNCVSPLCTLHISDSYLLLLIKKTTHRGWHWLELQVTFEGVKKLSYKQIPHCPSRWEKTKCFTVKIEKSAEPVLMALADDPGYLDYLDHPASLRQNGRAVSK